MSYESYLAHHGVKGMHWGVRRYQNPDGSLTDAGKKRNGIVSKIKEAKSRYIKGRDLRAIRDNYTDRYVIERQIGRRNGINHIRDKSSFAKANDKMVKKYGKQSLDDIHYADVYEAKVIIGTSLAAMGGMTVIAALNWH